MKAIKLVLSCALTLFFTTVSAQKSYLEKSEYPAKIVNFINDNFSESTIIYIKKDKDYKKTEYEVQLSTMEELEFDESFILKEAESKVALPSSILPDKINNYVKQNYPNSEIREWKRKATMQEIELSNKLELLFDLEGNFIRIDK